ncbi:MAG: hypothetical protein J6P16_00715 [Eubacterium sp.]|nr:hypothetical protein [Eubacterium sp.]
MTQINGLGAYQNMMMNTLNQKQKADADKNANKIEEQQKLRTAKNEKAQKSDKTAATQDTEVKLSDKAKALLDELKTKYGNMDFFVADYQTEAEAQSYLSRGTKDYSVLIDPATLEAMAADEETKTKYTDMIDSATAKLNEIRDQLEEDENTEVRRVGFTINDDGTMSMFAELEQISERCKEAIAREREARAAEAKEAEKRAEEKKEKEGQDDVTETVPADRPEGHGRPFGPRGPEGMRPDFMRPDEKVKRTVVTADNVEDLISQIKNVNWDEIEATDNKPPVGGKFDLGI